MIVRIISRILCLCLCTSWLASCSSPSEQKETEIVIISFSDLHGNFSNLAKISAFIQKTKAKHEHVIVVDAGDRFTGNPYNDFYEKTQEPIVNLLNTIGLDVAVIGNHEFDFGAELLRERSLMANYTGILANIRTTNTLLNKLIKPYHVIEVDDIEVGFLGLIGVDRVTGKAHALLDYVIDFTFYDPIETAMKHRNSLQKRSTLKGKNPQVYIALTHMGIEQDYRLADSVPELDLIIGGHSHYLMVEPEFRNGVKILANDKHGDHIFKTTIRVKNDKVTSIFSELIAVQTLKDEDPIVVEKVRGYENNPFLSTPILTMKHAFNEEQLGFLIVDAALSIPGVDFSILNCGSIRADTLHSGTVAYADVLRVYPFSNHYGIIGLKPAEMRMILESEFAIPKRCNAYPSGFTYVMDTTDNVTKIAKMLYPNGKELDENKVYRVVLNNFLLSRHFSKRQDEIVVLPIFIVDNIIGFMKENPNLNYRNAPKRALVLASTEN